MTAHWVSRRPAFENEEWFALLNGNPSLDDLQAKLPTVKWALVQPLQENTKRSGKDGKWSYLFCEDCDSTGKQKVWFADTAHKNRCDARKKRKMEFVDRDDSKIDHERRFDAVCAAVRTIDWTNIPVRDRAGCLSRSRLSTR